MDNHRKIRGDCLLNQLTVEQQDDVRAHCESTTLVAGVKWLKAQFNITLTDICLSKWLKKQRVNESIAIRLAQIRDARNNAALIGKVIGSATELTDANAVLIAQAVFEELVKPEEQRDEAKLVKYMSMALRAQGNELKGRSVLLAYQRHFFDGARMALKHVSKLREINQSSAAEATKIKRVMRLLFGEKPEITDFGIGANSANQHSPTGQLTLLPSSTEIGVSGRTS